MINKKKLLKTLIFGCAILFLTYVFPVKAQPGFETRLSGERFITKKERPPSRPKVVREVRTVTKEVVKTVTRRPSDLSVTTEPGAKVLLEPLNPRLKKQTKQLLADKDGGAIFGDLMPGKYKITVEKENFETLRQNDLVIDAQRNHVIKMDLEPITHNLTIETNVAEGEVRYAPADYIGEKDGALITKENGVYCFAPIKNKKAVIKGLKNGYYNIDIRPGDDYLQYDAVKTAIKIDETVGDSSSAADEPDFTIPLDTKFSTAPFDASAWTGADWNNNAGWKLNKKMKTDGLQGIVLPRNEAYRYYANFEMISGVRSLDDRTIGFVLRAEDDKNYYLVQISGEKAAEPLVVKPFIVKNGERKQLSAIPISHFSKIIKSKKDFRVIIRGEKNRFKIFIEDEDGKEREVGVFEDPNSNFRKGAVGIAGDKDSDFEVGVFMVCANKCS